MSFLKSLYTVLELDSSEEGSCTLSSKTNARTCDADASSSASTAGTTPVAPLFLNKLRESSEDHSDRYASGNQCFLPAYFLCFFVVQHCSTVYNVPKGLP